MTQEKNFSPLQSAWRNVASAIKTTITNLRKEFYIPEAVITDDKRYELLDNQTIRESSFGKTWRDQTAVKDVNVAAGTYNPVAVEYVPVMYAGGAVSYFTQKDVVKPYDMDSEDGQALREAGLKIAQKIIDDYNDPSKYMREHFYDMAVEFIEANGDNAPARLSPFKSNQFTGHSVQII